MKLPSFVGQWVPVILWMVIIFAASTDMMSAEHTSRYIGPFLHWLWPDISNVTVASVQMAVRKAAHVTEYAVLGLLLARAFITRKTGVLWRWAVLAWLVAVTWAGLDEFHQTFVASRTGSPIDVMIDATGALAGLALYCWFMRRRAVAVAVTA